MCSEKCLMCNVKWAILLLLCFVLQAVCEAADVYSLDDCLKIAKENNATLKSAKVNRQMAEEQEGGAFSAYFPKVYAGAFAFYANDYLAKQKVDLSEQIEGVGRQVAPTLAQAGIDPSILGGLPTSMSMGFLDKGLMGHLTLIQPVFVGGQIYNGNQLAKVGTKAAKLQEIMSENEVRKNTETFYWLIVQLKEKLKTIDAADSQLAGILGDVKTAVDAGVAVKNDQLRVELEQKKLKSNRLKVENGISTAKSMLARQMGRDDTDFELADFDAANVPAPEEYKMDAAEAVDRRIESKLLAVSREAAEKERSMERGKVLPTLAVGASLLYQNLLDDDALNGVLFAALSVPISDWWGKSYSTSRLDLKIQKARLDEEENKNLMKVDMNAKWNSLVEAYEQIKISEESMGQAEENLRMQRDYYSAGTAAISNLLEAQTLHQQTLDARTEAITNYYTVLCNYLIATGR